jgi:hypothetical protein
MKKTQKAIILLFGVFISVAIGVYNYSILYLRKTGFLPTIEKEENVRIEKSFIGFRIIEPSPAPIEVIFKKVSERAGFHTYYPTFIPSGVELNKSSIVWPNDLSTSKFVSYNLESRNLQLPWIRIMQWKISQENNSDLLRMIDSLTSKQEISLNGEKAFIGKFGSNTNDAEIKALIYFTQDGVAIQLRTKGFDFDTLVKIAESMK